MTYDPQKHNRRSMRLKGYDYSSPGLYFVTICTHKRRWLFGQISNGNMILNKWGEIARDEWLRTDSIRDRVELDAFVIMPNHVHGIVRITGANTPVGSYCDTTLRGDKSYNQYCDTTLRGDKTHGQNGDTTPRGNESPNQNCDTTQWGTESDQPNRPSTGQKANNGQSRAFRSPSKTLGAIIRGYKSAVTTRINKKRSAPGRKVWQRNYYDRIIRNEKALTHIRYYIRHNPRQWHNDKNNPPDF